jgi:ribosomal protein S18 acetylase RimI-like enzyme
MIIRPATVDDASDIARIHVDTWRDAYKEIVPDAYLRDLSKEKRASTWTESLLRSPTGTLVTLGDIGQIVGWVSFGASRDDDGSGIGELYAIYLQSDHWGKGYGKRLLAYAEHHLSKEGFSTITLWVLELNYRTRRFYEIAGYVADGTKKTLTICGRELIELRYRKTVQ